MLKRAKIHSLNEVLPIIKQKRGFRKNQYTVIDGIPIKITSDRYELFLQERICQHCGLEGTYFATEKNDHAKSYHFNLYGYDEATDEEVLFTKDHIIPKSKGGKNHISNYQCLCERCNSIKRDNYETNRKI